MKKSPYICNLINNQKQKVTLLTNFGNRNSFLSWLSGVKITPRPLPKKEVPKGQQSFDLKEFKIVFFRPLPWTHVNISFVYF